MVQSRSKVSKGGKCGKGKGKPLRKVGKGAKGKGAKGKFFSREVGDIKPKNNNR